MSGNECRAACVPEESTPDRQVLLLEVEAELYCGPCGKPTDNPVGVEQPVAFRFQQRQQPWFRDAVDWMTPLERDFINSQSHAEFAHAIERLRNEGPIGE